MRETVFWAGAKAAAVVNRVVAMASFMFACSPGIIGVREGSLSSLRLDWQEKQTARKRASLDHRSSYARYFQLGNIRSVFAMTSFTIFCVSSAHRTTSTYKIMSR